MQRLMREYEQSRAMLLTRIQSLNAELRQNETLGNKERDILLLRRNLLMTERAELSAVIHEMERHGTGNHGGCVC